MMELLTVKELRDYLETLDDELPIILGDDEVTTMYSIKFFVITKYYR